MNQEMIEDMTNDTTHRVERRVSFSNNLSDTIVVDGLSDLDEDGIGRKLWYSPRDIDELRERYMQSIYITRMKLSHQSRAEIVGLEKHLSSELSKEFKRRKAEVYSAINTELEFQQDYLKEHNWDRLATISSHHSKWAFEQAHYAAKLLMQDVELATTPVGDMDHSRALAA